MKIMDTIGFVENVDKEVGEAMEAELARQRRKYRFTCRYGCNGFCAY